MEEINLMPKNAEFNCKICDFTCCKKSNFLIHVNTKKHVYGLSGNQMETVEIKKNADFICKCGKKFITNSGLWKHNKICNFKETQIIVLKEEPELKHNSTDKKDELIDYLIKENQEFKNLILEIVKKDTYNTTNNNNSHNKTFNLQFFLNETCKDAMNIMDFVDSIKLQLSDLENVGKLGYVEGISNIITTNLKALDVTQRPVHCADKKREIIYVKDEDKWEKEDENKKKIKRAIRRVVCKNQHLLPKFKDAHPDCLKSASKFSDQYNKILVESMGGSGDNDIEKEDKIIRNISKSVTINKEC